MTEQALFDTFNQIQDWQTRYRQIILMANQCPMLADSDKTDHHLITGCENHVWLTHKVNNERKISFYGDSEARIIKGILSMLIMLANHKKSKEIIDYDFIHALKTLKIMDNLSESKQFGVSQIIEKIKFIAQNIE